MSTPRGNKEAFGAPVPELESHLSQKWGTTPLNDVGRTQAFV